MGIFKNAVTIGGGDVKGKTNEISGQQIEGTVRIGSGGITVSSSEKNADAPQVLADRLARRLAEQLRTGGPITDPVGWLLARGLPQRQECGDARCDNRVLLDSGRDCPCCEERREDRRARRRKVAANVAAALPHASEDELWGAVAKRLHRDVMARA